MRFARFARASLLATVAWIGLANHAAASPLSDGQLYFDPGSIVPDFYPQIFQPVGSSQVFSANADPIVGFNILPMLKDNDYSSPGYVYSQNDYYFTPNADYSADLSGGSVLATFNQAGTYEVRITRASSATEIDTIFVDSDLGKDPPAQDKTGALKKIDVPTGDLFLIANEPTDGYIQGATQALTQAGRTTDTMSSKQDIIDKAKARSLALGRKIHLELVGHGRAGSIRLAPGVRINVDDATKEAELAMLQSAIDQYVDKITFVSCTTGAGTPGQKFLGLLAASIGSASAWDTPIWSTKVGTGGYFSVDKNAKYITLIPEPASAAICIFAVTLVLGRRRTA